MKKALVTDGVAVNVIAADLLAEAFHPDIAAQFVTVPEQVDIGWRLDGGEWTAPEVVEPTPPEPMLPAATVAERLASLGLTAEQIAEVTAP